MLYEYLATGRYRYRYMFVSELCAIHKFGAVHVREFSAFAASSARLAAAISRGSANSELEFRTASNLWIAQGSDTNVLVPSGTSTWYYTAVLYYRT